MTPLLRLWLASVETKNPIFIEPFAGGASASLLAVDEKFCSEAHFAEIDTSVASVWQCILSDEGPSFAAAVAGFDVTTENLDSLLGPQRGRWSTLRKALAVLVRNRTQRGGVMAPGAGRLKKGEKGHGPKSRWYAGTLAKRIQHIHELKSKLSFYASDGFALLEQFGQNPHAVTFVDPPYYVAAERLYSCWQMDHRRVFTTLNNFQGNFLLAYDDAPEIRSWISEFGFDAIEVGMKTTNHDTKHELIIGRNLSWADHRTPKSSQAIAPAVQERSLENISVGSRPAA